MKIKQKLLSILLCFAMVLSMTPQIVLAEDTGFTGLCEHHTEHTDECGYTGGAAGSPCTHVHTEDCYVSVTSCVHEHTAECCQTDSVSGNGITPSETEGTEPTACTHVCSEESGCITKVLDCPHERGEHDESCGYAPAAEGTPCGYVCQVCEVQELIDALPALSDMESMGDDEREAAIVQYTEAYEAYEALSDEQKAQVTGAEVFDEFLTLMNAGVTLENGTMSGSGTAEDPYIITDAADLNAVRNNLSAHYKLGNDIDLSSYENWTPIGTYSQPFKGSFDGGEFTISNLKVNVSTTDSSSLYAGLFGCIDEGSEIKNLNVRGNIEVNNSSITNNRTYAGGIVGRINAKSGNMARVTNCTFEGAVKVTVANTPAVGGIIGYSSFAYITGCSNAASITASVTSTAYLYPNTGGIVGIANYSEIRNCYNTGAISASHSGTHSLAGGIVGSLGLASSISNAYSTGKVESKAGTGDSSAGGIAGEKIDSIELEYSYYLEGTASTGVGGYNGSEGAISKTADQFASGEVANLLQGEQSESVWGQSNLGQNGSLPGLMNSPGGSSLGVVYKVTFMNGDQEISSEYVNSGGSVSFPESPAGESWQTFAGWYSTATGGTRYEGSVSNVTGNMTVYARFSQSVPGDNEGYTINYKDETISVTDKDAYELSTSKEATATGSESLPRDSGTAAYTVYIRRKATGNADPSDWKAITVDARPTLTIEPTASASSMTVKAGNVPGGATVSYQLVADGGAVSADNWKTAGADGSYTFSNLLSSTSYTVYAKCSATDTSFASAEQSLEKQATKVATYTVTIPAGPVTAGSGSSVTIQVDQNQTFDIGYNDVITVTAPANVTLVRSGDTQTTLTSAMLVNDSNHGGGEVIRFDRDNYTSAAANISFAQPVIAGGGAIPAGTYTGKMTFTISCSPKSN